MKTLNLSKVFASLAPWACGAALLAGGCASQQGTAAATAEPETRLEQSAVPEFVGPPVAGAESPAGESEIAGGDERRRGFRDKIDGLEAHLRPMEVIPVKHGGSSGVGAGEAVR